MLPTVISELVHSAFPDAPQMLPRMLAIRVLNDISTALSQSDGLSPASVSTKFAEWLCCGAGLGELCCGLEPLSALQPMLPQTRLWWASEAVSDTWMLKP